jgi:predicted phosphoribosyltransferase
MFENRRDAGIQLARALEEYRDESVLVLAIPRGGVEVAYQVASELDAELSLLVTRKLPFPHNPEAGFGAIAEDGSTFVWKNAAQGLSTETMNQIMKEQRAEIERRIDVLRGGRSLPEIAGRTVILVDDGIAMGSTMRASIKLCRKKGAGKVVVAVPVAGPRVSAEMGAVADELVVLEKPSFFRAVAQVYRQWYDVPDSEVLEIMARWREKRIQTMV